MPSSTRTLPRFSAFFKDHSDAVSAGICALLVFLGWIALNTGWLGIALLILSAAYVIGGLDSAKEGLTTLIQEKELDIDLLTIAHHHQVRLTIKSDRSQGNLFMIHLPCFMHLLTALLHTLRLTPDQILPNSI